MNYKILLIALISIALTSCGADKNEKLIGLWEAQNEGQYWHPAVVRIVKDGSTYLYQDAINFEKTEYQVTLKRLEGQLILDSRFVPELPLSLIENDSVLLIGQRRFARTEESNISVIREKSALEKQRKEQELKDLIDSIN